MDNGWFLLSYIVLWALVGLSFLLWLAVLRQIGIFHSRWGPRGVLATEEGPAIGTVVPRFRTPSVDGVDLEFPGEALINLAVVVNPNCSVCDLLAPSLHTLMRDAPEGLETIVLLSDGDDETARELARRHNLKPAGVASVPFAASMLNIQSTPMALVLDRDGRLLGKGIANSLEQLEVLVAQSRTSELARAEGDGHNGSAESSRVPIEAKD